MSNLNNNQKMNREKKEFSITISELIENIIYYRLVFAAVAGFIILVTIIWAIFATPIYTSDVLIQVDDKKANPLANAMDSLGSAFDTSSKITGEIEIFKSRSVIGRAVETLFLHTDATVNNRIPIVGGLLYRFLPRDANGLAIPPVDWMNVGWGGEDIIFDAFNVPDKYISKHLFLIVGSGGAWNIFNDDDDLVATGRVGIESLSEDGQWQINIRTLKANPGTEFKLVRYSLPSRIAQIKARLDVKESGKQSGILVAKFDDKSPSFSHRMLNAIAQSYVDQNTERRAEEAEKSLTFLSKKLPELKNQMEASDSSLTQYRNQNAKLDVPKEIDTLIKESVDIGQARRELEIRKSENSQRYQSAHPMMKSIESQLSKLKAEADALEKQVRALPESQQKYVNIEREAQINSNLYQSLLETSQQLQVTKAGTVGNVSVIDYAAFPESPSKPNKLTVVALGGILGILLGALAANIFSILMGNVRDPKKLEELIGLKMLALIPFAIEQPQGNVKEGQTEFEPFMLGSERPNSTTVEAIRSLRVALQFALINSARKKVVLITSAIPAQGKSFISANLAYLLAASGKKTILIDADIRKSSLKYYLPVGKSLGLSEVLQQNAILDEVVNRDIFPNLDLISAGRRAKNPGELFVEGHINEVVEWAAANYDFVIIDSPPVLPVNDSVVLSKMTDVTIFIVRQDKVSLHEINASLELFMKSGTTPDGVVFNSFVPSHLRYGYFGYPYVGIYSTYDAYGLETPEVEQLRRNEINTIDGVARYVLNKTRRKVQKRLTNLFRKLH